VIDDRIIVGSAYGEVYSIDLESGCVHWVFSGDAAVRGAIAIGDGPDGGQSAFFADFATNVYAIDATTGALHWRAAARTPPAPVGAGRVPASRPAVPPPAGDARRRGRPAHAAAHVVEEQPAQERRRHARGRREDEVVHLEVGNRPLPYDQQHHEGDAEEQIRSLQQRLGKRGAARAL